MFNLINLQLIILIVLILWLIKYLFICAPFVPTHAVDLDRINKIISDYQIKNMCDLGCGNGRVLDFLGEKKTETNFFGIELALLLYLFCRFRFLGRKNIRVKYGSAFWRAWDGYDALFLFWLPRYLKKYSAKFIQKTVPGQLVISYAFPVEALTPCLIPMAQPANHLPIYLYQIK